MEMRAVSTGLVDKISHCGKPRIEDQDDPGMVFPPSKQLILPYLTEERNE